MTDVRREHSGAAGWPFCHRRTVEEKEHEERKDEQEARTVVKFSAEGRQERER